MVEISHSIWVLHYIWPLTFSLCNWVFYWGHYQTAALKPNILHTVEYSKYKQGIEIYHNKECIRLLWNFPKCNAGVCSRDSFGRYYPSLYHCVCVKLDVVKKAIYHRVLAFFSCTLLNFVINKKTIYRYLLKPFVRLAEFNRLPIRCFVAKLGEEDKLAFQKCLVWKMSGWECELLLEKLAFQKCLVWVSGENDGQSVE